MKITLYTVTDCQFSKQEKEYLASHTLSFEEKNLETNRDFLTEMLTLSNNFAGTPVTKIDKDDGQIVVLKGFTKDEFDKALGFAVEPVTPSSVPTTPTPTVTQPSVQPAAQNPPVQPSPPPIQDHSEPPTEVAMPESISPPAPVTPQLDINPISPVQEPQAPQPPEAPNPMNSVLNNLQDQATATPPLPNIPDPKL